MSTTIKITRLPEGIRVEPAPTPPQRSRVPAIVSIVSQVLAHYAINGALSELDAPGNPFVAE